MIKIKEICRMKGRCILVSLCFLFIPDCFSQKLKPVVVKKLEGDVYSKEEYSIIKRGKDKGKRHGEYTYSKFTKEMTGVYFFDLKIKTTGLSLIDNLMFKYNLQFLITTICFLILINGSNFIDGINGNLALHYVCLLILILLIFSYNRLGLDILILSTIISFIVFLYFNFKNRIFFGDGGAYLSGFILGIFILEIMYLEIYISPFFYIILTFYLGSEVLISFLRRIIKKENVMIADFNHLHSLLFTILSKKIKLNPHVSTSLIINFVYVILVMPAIFFADNFELTRYYSLFLYLVYFLLFFSINKIAKKI